jgi:hypothetical protein
MTPVIWIKLIKISPVFKNHFANVALAKRIGIAVRISWNDRGGTAEE